MDLFLKASKAKETKGFFPYEWFDSPDNLDCTELPPYEAFFTKQRNHNPLEKNFHDYQKLFNGGLDQQSALKNLCNQSVLPTGLEYYSYLKSIWEQLKMITSKDFLRWYNNKEVVLFLLLGYAKNEKLYHDKGHAETGMHTWMHTSRN